MVNTLILSIYWDPRPEVFSWNLPLLGRPILWYGLFFAVGFCLGYLIFKSLLQSQCGYSKEVAKKISEKTGLFVGIGAIVGARLFDVLFYQNPSSYVHDPLEVIRFWQGGLASHGAVLGILIAFILLRKSLKKKFPELTWKRLIDLASVPALVAGAFIRVGNFFNQEIIGTASTLPWAVVFGHPADGNSAISRHPAQLYEALFYLILAAILWTQRSHLKREGKIGGLFFMGCFGFRFLVEFVKAKQSAILPGSFPLDMGQLLSIPAILFGLFLYCTKGAIRVKRH